MNGFICKALAVHTSNIIYLNIYTQVIYIQIPQIPYKPTPKEVNDEQNQWIINYLTHETLILYSSLFSNVIYIKQYYNTIY